MDEYVDDVVSYLTDQSDWDKPFLEDKDLYPCMMMNCGSAFCFNKVHEPI